MQQFNYIRFFNSNPRYTLAVDAWSRGFNYKDYYLTCKSLRKPIIKKKVYNKLYATLEFSMFKDMEI